MKWGPKSKVKTALVLSGGATKGAFEVGVLKVLIPLIKPDCIIGTSIGAMNAAMIASGTPIEELEARWHLFGNQINMFAINKKIFFKLWKAKSIFSNKNIKKLAEGQFGHKEIQDCDIPLYINATKLSTGTSEFFHEGRLVDAVLASTALPPLFPPHTFHGEKYIDGGIGSLLGLQKALDLKCKQVIVVNLSNPIHFSEHDNNLFYVTNYAMDQLMHDATTSTIEEYKSKVHLVDIELKELKHIGSTDFSHTKELIALGEKEAKKQAKKIKL